MFLQNLKVCKCIAMFIQLLREGAFWERCNGYQENSLKISPVMCRNMLEIC